MKCQACDTPLTPFESTRKSKATGEYLDLCNRCFAPIEKEIPVIVRRDLMEYNDRDDDERWDEGDDKIDYNDY